MKDTGREVVIVEAARTPIGRGHPRRATTATRIRTSCSARPTPRDRARGIDPNEVEDVITGCVQQYGEQMFNVGRNAWLQEGLPVETPATTVDRQCGSAQQAVNFAAALIAAGVHDAAIGSGVEHMGHIPMGVGFKWVDEVGSPWPEELMAKYNLVPQGISAEMIADKWEIPRSELDELGVRSHQLAHQATEEGRFERETVPFQVNGDTYVADQGIRPRDTLETLRAQAGLQGGRRVTAGNSSQISDGAAALLLMERAGPSRSADPRARILDQTTVGVDPVIMLTGRSRHAQAPRAQRMQIGDIDLFEVNEAFASVLAAWRRELQPGLGPGERERRSDRARPSARLDRRAPSDHVVARARAHRQGGRARDDVLRRRSRYRNADRAHLRPRRGGRRPVRRAPLPCGATPRTGG
jgi:acetyl-CoA acetyltransferase family protein